MDRRREVAGELSVIMPKIVRMIALKFSKSYQHMPPAQIFTILLMAENRHSQFSEIVKQLHVSAPTASGVVDRLVKQKMLKRVHSKCDRRAVNIEITAKGAKVAVEIRKGIKKRWALILEVLTINECEEYLSIVKKLSQRL